MAKLRRWITTLLLLFVITRRISAKQITLPCHFNSMCSCKVTSVSTTISNATEEDDQTEHLINVTKWKSDDSITQKDDDDGHHNIVTDVSCVNVPLAFVPDLPPGKISHLDIVNSGLEVASSVKVSQKRIQLESLRLMNNRLRRIEDFLLSSMGADLKSLDVSFNELDEIPVKALLSLTVLDWANFHSNRLTSLDGLGQLWLHLSPTLHALFLGNNDLTQLQRSTKNGKPQDDSIHHSLAHLKSLKWINLDGNKLTDLPIDSLPPRLHTLSCSHNFISQFPMTVIQELQDLRFLDLRDNFISTLPSESLQTSSGGKLKLDKLDLGENHLGSFGSLFNRSLQVRDLYLDFNRLTRLNDSAFRGTQAQRLYLSSNALVHIDERAFHSLSSSLTLLDLDNNRLDKFPVALHHLKRLRFLYLAGNKIKSMDQDDLSSFGINLEAISLSGNQLEGFPTSALRHTKQLAHLNLAFNLIKNVTSDTFFNWGDNLEVLILKGNQISILPDRLFRHAKRLRELSLSFNPLVSINEEALIDIADSLETLELNLCFEKSHFPIGLLKNLHQLQWLSLEHNRISTLPAAAVDHLHQLRYFSIEGNGIKELGSLFKGNRLRQLRDFRASYNNLEHLKPRTFHQLSEITTIIITHNRLQKISHSAFDNLPNILTLNLASNRLIEIENFAFSSLPNLLKIELQENRLQTFGWDIFYNASTNENLVLAASLNLSNNLISTLLPSSQRSFTTSIKTLDLSVNRLSSYPSSQFLSFLSPFSLQRLLLRDNRISKLSGDLTKYCQHLTVLDLNNNAIEELDRMAFRDAIYMQIIDLGSNEIEILPTGVFANLNRLRIVNLSSNRLKISGLPKDVFDGSVVETLNLSNNFLISLPVNSLSSIATTLAYLDISSNQIDHLDAIMFSYIPNLISLNLAHNKLSLLPDNVFYYLNSLVSLDLSFNTIRANFKELFHELQHVKELQLSNIGLSTWPSLSLPHLLSLNLSGNALDFQGVEHNSNIVMRLSSLRALDLSRNKFVSIPSFLWSFTPILTHLDISANPIRIVNRDSFSGLIRLQTLTMQPLPVLETIENDSFNSLFFLNQLMIQSWPGPTLSQLLSNMRGLRKLSLEIKSPVLSTQLNQIATIDTATKLREIEISGSQLKAIQQDVFSKIGIYTLPHCTISLKNTGVRSLPHEFLKGLEGCSSLTLDLQTNAIQTLGSHVIRNNNSLSFTSTRHLSGGLWLENNSLTCSCEIMWLGKWLRRWYLETGSNRHPVSTLSLSSTTWSFLSDEAGERSELTTSSQPPRIITPKINAITCRDPNNPLSRKRLIDLPTNENTCSTAKAISPSFSYQSYMIFLCFLSLTAYRSTM